jgi:hypothetical protein
MSFPVLIPAVFVFASLISYFVFRKSQVAAIGFAVSCLLGAMFFAFGFLASFEGTGGPFATAKIVYAVLFVSAIAGIISAIRRVIRVGQTVSD